MPLPKPANPFAPNNHFGISFTTNAIRGVVVNPQGQIVSKHAVVFNSPILTPQAVNQESIAKGLTDLLSVLQPNTSFAAVILPEKFAYAKEHQIALVKVGEIDEAINWQIDKIFPFTANEVYFDWKIINSTATHHRILVTAIPKNILDEIKIAMDKVGLYPIAFEPSASVCARLVTDQQVANPIILELETYGTSATLVIDGISRLTITTPMNPDATTKVWQEIVQSLLTLASKLKQEVPSTKNFTILLTGEKCNQQIADYLSQATQLAVSLINIPIEPTYHLSYAAAQAEIAPPENSQTINLLPTAIQQEYTQSRKEYFARKNLIAATALAIPSLILSLGGFLSLQIMVNSLNRQVTELTSQQSATSPLDGLNAASITAVAKKYVDLFPLKTTPIEPLQAINKSTNEQIIITALAHNPLDKSIKLIGVTQNRQSLIVFVQTLEETGLFGEIIIPLSAYQDNQNFTFSLDFSLKGTL